MDSNYLSISDLINKLNEKAKKLEKGKLSVDSLNEMLEESRDIYERITILRYRALLEVKEVTIVKTEHKVEVKSEEKEEKKISLKFSIPSKEVEKIIPINQKNLLDEIQEIDEIKTSVNDQFANNSNVQTVGEKLNTTKIGDLRKEIRLNQKFLFMNDLFEGEKMLYDKTIDKINTCETLLEASLFLKEEIEETYNWDSESPTVIQFKELVSRKFS